MAQNLARFTISGTASEDANGKRGYDATAGEVLAITLEQNPALVLTVTYQLFDASQPFGETPLNSLYDTAQVFDENGLKAITSSSPNDTFHITINPSTEISSYALRCTVVTAQGAQVFERLIVVRKNGLRMTIPAEVAQYDRRGWSDAMNELTKAVADGAVGSVLVDSANTGIVAAFPSGSRRVFHSDGSTAGGTWAVLTSTDMAAVVADAAIPITKLAPGTNGQVLRTTGGVAAWGADVTLNPPANPGEDNLVAIASGGDLTYGQIANAQVASGANIAVSKLAAGSDGQVLKTVGSAVQWSSDDQLTAPVNPTDDGRVALASGGDLVYGLISNSQVDASAAIAVSKLATGSEGYVLKVVGGTPTWAVEGGGGANLPATPGDDDKVAFANSGNLDYADGVLMLNSGGAQNALGFTGARFASGASTPVTPTGSEGVLWNASGAAQWSTTAGAFNLLRSPQPADPGDNNRVAVASSGQLTYALLLNANISASAGIEVSKLGAGSANEVLVTSGSTPTWATLVNANIASGAAIAVSKLANGTNGQYLRTSGTVAVWTSDLEGSQLINGSVTAGKMAPNSANYVLRTNFTGTAVEWGKLVNINLADSAAISVTKLAPGASNSVLASNGSTNFWDTTPTVSTLTGTSALITQGYMEFQNSSMPGNAPSQGARLFAHDWGVLAARFDDNTVWEIAVEAFN